MLKQVFVTAWLLCPAWLGGQTVTADSAETRRAITALEERVGRANFDCDYAFFSAVEAPEFMFTDARGSVITRAEDLAGERQCKPRKGQYALDEIRMQFHGPLVIFNARATTTSFRDSLPPTVLRTRFTDVFVWRDSKWQMVAGHSSRIP